MRIVAGDFKGLALAALGKGDMGAHLRPTTDRVRESLFNVLQGGKFGTPLEGARVLDLFAGTGALGLEALSRGADHICFVDDGRKAQQLIRQNIKICSCAQSTQILNVNALKLPQNTNQAFDLIFLDPPYEKQLGEKALEQAFKNGWIADDALIVWEESAAINVPDELNLLDSRKYGATKIHFLEPS